MKKRTVAIIGLILFGILTQGFNVVSASSTTWSKTYGEGKAYDLVETPDGEFVIAAVRDNDFWLVKTDANGTIQWNRTYGGPESETVKALVMTSDGGFAVLGQFTDGHGNCDCLLVKTDSYGNMEWNQTYGRRFDFVNSLIETSDGGYAIAGSFCSDRDDPFGDRDFWLIKTDNFGNKVWTQTYGEGKYYDSASALVETIDGGYLLVGSRSIYLVWSTSWIIKTDEQGNLEWDKEFEKENSGANSVVKAVDGGYVVIGYRSPDFWIVKIDQTGNLEWNHTYSQAEDAEAHSMVNTSDGGYALAGVASRSIGQQTEIDSWIVKTDPSGNIVWNQTYGGPGNQQINSIIETSNKGFVLAGFQTSNESELPELWLIKTDEQGVIPEFPSGAIWVLVFVTTLTSIVYKKRMHPTKTTQT